MNGKPIINELNNGVLSSIHAMPLKNLTSDNGESFAINRNLFEKAYQPPVNYSLAQTTKSFFQRRSPAIDHGFVIDGPKSVRQKKWIGGNRDASSIIMHKRMNTTGSSMTKTGPQSYNTTNDKNPRIEALARVRGGGARVPLKVVNRPATFYLDPLSIPKYFRVVSAGLKAVSSGVVNVSGSGSSANGVSPGFYSCKSNTDVGVPIATISNGLFGRSYNLLTINRTTGAMTTTLFDVFGSLSQANYLASILNSLTNLYMVILATYDEPRNSQGSFLPSNLITAIQQCGGSSNFGSSTGSPPGILNYRGAYVLVGIPGIGTGKGTQYYIGDTTEEGDPNAALDVRFSVLRGEYQ